MNVLQNALSVHLDGGVEFFPDKGVFDPECGDEIALVTDGTHAVQRALERSAIQVSSYGKCSATSKSKARLHD